MPTPKVKPLDKAKEKFVKRVSIAGPEYEFFVKNPVRDWLTEFIDAIDRIHDGLKNAIEQGIIKGGAERKGTSFWKSRTSRKGPPRWKEETPKSGDTWEVEWKDFKKQIEETPISKKRTKGDRANIDERLWPIVQRLIALKKEKRGYKPAGTPTA